MSEGTSSVIVIVDDAVLILMPRPQEAPPEASQSWPGGTTHREDGAVSRESEAAYRRGFNHGANEVIEAVASGQVSLSGLRDWLHHDVQGWRYNPDDLRGSDRAELVPPPEVPGRRIDVTSRTRHGTPEYATADQSQVEYAAL